MNRSDDGLTENPKPEIRRYVNCAIHDGGLNICATFNCKKYGNWQKFLCVRWGSGPCIIPGMQRPGRETSHSSYSSSAVRMDVPIPLPVHFRVHSQLLVVILKEFAGQPIGPITRGSRNPKRNRRSHAHRGCSLNPSTSNSTFSNYHNTVTQKHYHQPSISATP